MGKKVLLVTPALQERLLRAAYLLRRGAIIRERNIKLIAMTSNNPKIRELAKFLIAEIVDSRKIAKSFTEMAKRMELS